MQIVGTLRPFVISCTIVRRHIYHFVELVMLIGDVKLVLVGFLGASNGAGFNSFSKSGFRP